MTKLDDTGAEKTYLAIGRFIFEFSQAEYAIRYHLAQEIGLAEKHFVAVVESYDIAMLCTVALEVFGETRSNSNAVAIKDLINKFRKLSHHRNRVAHGLWIPSKEGDTVRHVPRDAKPSLDANQAANLNKLADDANSLRDKLEWPSQGRLDKHGRSQASQSVLAALTLIVQGRPWLKASIEGACRFPALRQPQDDVGIALAPAAIRSPAAGLRDARLSAPLFMPIRLT